MKKIIKLTTIFLVILLLSACNSRYNVKVDLSPEDVQKTEEGIEKLKADIAEYDTSDGTIPVSNIVTLAKEYEKLGNIGKAIDLYNSWLKKGFKAQAMINNLGKLYDKVGETDKAVEQYLRLIADYQEDRYLYDITWSYINGKQRKNAEKYFNMWQLKFQKTDIQTQQAIKKLREEEKPRN